MKCPKCGYIVPDDHLIKLIATPREYEAWQSGKRGMKAKHIAEDMGICKQRYHQLRKNLRKKIKKMVNSL